MSKQINDKLVEADKTIQKLADEIIAKNKMDFGIARIAYLKVYPYVSKTLAARCIKASLELKFFTEADYVIEVSGEIWDALNVSTRKILLYNQLSKIAPKYNDKKGIWKFNLAPFDTVGFKHVIKVHGVDWIDDVRATIESLYDMDSTETRKVGI